jgi:hypothetical protein
VGRHADTHHEARRDRSRPHGGGGRRLAGSAQAATSPTLSPATPIGDGRLAITPIPIPGSFVSITLIPIPGTQLPPGGGIGPVSG